MKKLLFLLFMISIFLLSSCSNSSKSPTEVDTIDPTVSLDNISNGSEVSGIFNVIINAQDNKKIDRVAVYFDGVKIKEMTSSPYECDINCNDYQDGEHTLQAKAWDESGNMGITNIITITTNFDFAPYSNGKITVTISHYKQLNAIDIASFGDPFFVYIIEINNHLFDTYTSPVWQDTEEINSNITHTFDIPDNTREYKLTVYVRDKEISGYEPIDYTPDNGNAYYFILKPYESDFTGTYSGANDGHYDENDCVITLSVNTVD